MIDFIAALPKISLHVHLEGSVAPATAVELARKHGVAVPGERDADTLYDIDAHADPDEFLRVYDTVGRVVRDTDDFHRITYETLAAAASHQVLYREMFFSPSAHPGVPLRTQLDGMTAGLRDAAVDHDIGCRLIMGLNREQPPSAAVELIEALADDRPREVIGVGLDYAEVNGPPQRFTEAFGPAGRGLHRPAHSEPGPARHSEVLLDELGCSRIDHGHHVVVDERILARCVDQQVTFTCTPISSDAGRYSRDGSGTHETIATMIGAGLRVAIDCEDPPMFDTDPTNDLRVLAQARGYENEQLMALTENALAGSWLDETDKHSLRRRIDKELDALRDRQERLSAAGPASTAAPSPTDYRLRSSESAASDQEPEGAVASPATYGRAGYPGRGEQRARRE